MPLHLLDWTCDGVDHRRVSVPVAYTEIWIGAAGGLCAASQERRNNLVQLFPRRRRRMGFARSIREGVRGQQEAAFLRQPIHTAANPL